MTEQMRIEKQTGDYTWTLVSDDDVESLLSCAETIAQYIVHRTGGSCAEWATETRVMTREEIVSVLTDQQHRDEIATSQFGRIRAAKAKPPVATVTVDNRIRCPRCGAPLRPGMQECGECDD